jgi:hypothetical protein
MGDTGGSSTLIFSKTGKIGEEHFINLAAAWMTSSEFSHVELAIGDECGQSGQMRNVLRIFNDRVGVELVERTGKNPQFVYLQIGCSKQAEQNMLTFARAQREKPFSINAMIRSVIWPRRTKGGDYFCAELVAACLQSGGLLSMDSNPGAATPESLHKLYSAHATATANPCVMRRIQRERASRVENGSVTVGAAQRGSALFPYNTAPSNRNHPQGLHAVSVPPASFSFRSVCPSNSGYQPIGRPAPEAPQLSMKNLQVGGMGGVGGAGGLRNDGIGVGSFRCNGVIPSCVQRPASSSTAPALSFHMPLRSLGAIRYERPHSN